MYKHLENKMCKELEALEEKYRTGMEMNEGDLRRVDLLAHSLKSLAAFNAMKQAEEGYQDGYYPNNNGSSYRNSMSGNAGLMSGTNPYMQRYRDMETSGHYPMNYPYEDRRW